MPEYTPNLQITLLLALEGMRKECSHIQTTSHLDDNLNDPEAKNVGLILLKNALFTTKNPSFSIFFRTHPRSYQGDVCKIYLAF